VAPRNPNPPLWLELLLATGAVAVIFGLEQAFRSSAPDVRRRPGLNESRGQDHEYHEDSEIGQGQAGAIDSRPSQEPRDFQRGRAAQVGRGREASGPRKIPVKGWKDILWRVYQGIQQDRLLAVAGGVVFYMLLALFPALAALVSIYGLFSDPASITAHLSLLQGMLPESTIGIIEEQVTRLSATSSNALSVGFFLGLGIALWSANAGMKALIDSLNVVYDEQEKRNFVKLTLVAFAFTLGGLCFVILALGAVVILPLVLAWLGLETQAARIISLLRWPALFLILLAWLAVLYRYAPSRARPKWQWLSLGSLFASIVWLIGSVLFSWYLSNFANYDATYGSLGAVVGLMMWLWISVIVILVGAELNAEMEHH
jgi:membrane protein